MPVDLALLRRSENRGCGQLGAVVRHEAHRLAAPRDHHVELECHAKTGLRGVGDHAQTFSGAIVTTARKRKRHRDGKPISDTKLEALRRLTAVIVTSRGWPSERDTKAFLDAGYLAAQVLEFVLGVELKTLSNYANHIASIPLNATFAGVKWSKAL